VSDIKCIGCGATIQHTDPNAIGFAPKKFEGEENVVCKRCFRLKNYSDAVGTAMTNEEYYQILNTIGEKDALIVNIVDLYDFSGSIITGLNRFAMGNPVIMLGNKRDLLPKAIKDNRIVNFMKREAREMGLVIQDAVCISAEKGHGIEEALDLIEEYREGRDVFIVGCTNVGKSSFINQLLKKFAGEEKEWITTSLLPGTTLGSIEIPLDEESSLIDTPGIINDHQMAHFINYDTLKIISPKKEIKPKTYQLTSDQTLFFGGLARMDFAGFNKTNVTLYASNELNIHRTKTEKADELFKNHLGELLTPPGPNDLEKVKEQVKHSFVIDDEDMDVVISGLGWVKLKAEGQKVTVYAPRGVGVFVRRALI
jgi:ribosome biogenesis GTPase YqeH